MVKLTVHLFGSLLPGGSHNPSNSVWMLFVVVVLSIGSFVDDISLCFGKLFVWDLLFELVSDFI